MYLFNCALTFLPFGFLPRQMTQVKPESVSASFAVDSHSHWSELDLFFPVASKESRHSVKMEIEVELQGKHLLE